MPPDGVGRSPGKSKNPLTVGHSRHLTSGGKAVVQERILLKKQESSDLSQGEDTDKKEPIS